MPRLAVPLVALRHLTPGINTMQTRIGIENTVRARKHEIEQLKLENRLESTDAKIWYKNKKIIQLLERLNDLDTKLLESPEFQA